MRDSVSGFAEGRAEVANDVLQFVLFLLGVRFVRAIGGIVCVLCLRVLCRHEKYLVVRVLQIPIVEQRHQDEQTLKLVRSDEGIVFPTPIFEPLDLFRPRLEPDVGKAAALAHGNFFTRLRCALDLNARGQVVDLCHVADSPHKAHGSRLRLRFVAEFGDPGVPCAVAHAKLDGVAARLVFDESDVA